MEERIEDFVEFLAASRCKDDDFIQKMKKKYDGDIPFSIPEQCKKFLKNQAEKEAQGLIAAISNKDEYEYG